MRECREDFANWHDDVLEVFDCLDVPYKWALIGRPPLEHCSVGRVTLLGDACHPTLPTLGQGANMTMEDAMILERCLEASTDVAETLKRYENVRLDPDVAYRAEFVRSCSANAQPRTCQPRSGDGIHGSAVRFRRA